jgi:ectoine hydroxylase-related dioxygenase (phytanoyl-CoA dioxygenase family)
MYTLDPKVLTHSVMERKKYEDEYTVIEEEISIKGYSILKNIYSAEEISNIKKILNEAYKKQLLEIGGEENLIKINDNNIARGLCAYNDIFIDIAVNEKVVNVLKRIFKTKFILVSQNGIINKPGTNHYQFTWHRDLNYQHYTSSRPLAISTLLCLDPFNELTGGTYILEASHKSEAFPTDGYVLENQKVVNANPGDFIIFDCMLFHRTGLNNSSSDRRAINHIYAHPSARQQYSFPGTLGEREDIKDENIRSILGYGSETPLSALDWRLQKIKNLEGTK